MQSPSKQNRLTIAIWFGTLSMTLLGGRDTGEKKLLVHYVAHCPSTTRQRLISHTLSHQRKIVIVPCIITLPTYIPPLSSLKPLVLDLFKSVEPVLTIAIPFAFLAQLYIHIGDSVVCLSSRRITYDPQ